MTTISRSDVLRFRFARQQLDRAPGSVTDPGQVAVLDYGVQDTGPDGSGWALALRGLDRADQRDLALGWTLRGAPHAYRRADLPAVAVATAPLSEADAAKRVFDAAKPLRAAGIAVLDALRLVAGHLRHLASSPIPKGDASSRLTDLLDEPYLRWCRPCQATHIYEQPFRLAALQAGLELQPGTSPPVLQRAPRLRPPMLRQLGTAAQPHVDVVRNHLRFYGPVRPRDVAAFLDAASGDVTASWPEDAVEVSISGDGSAGQPERTRRGAGPCILADDLDELRAAGRGPGVVRLLGPFDPYLQLRDRELLVADAAHRKVLWPVLGRPGAVVVDGEVRGTWRPRSSGKKLTVEVEHWERARQRLRSAVDEQAERLAAHREVPLAGVAHG